MSVEVVQYDDSKRTVWNEFVRNAKNGHFMFDRDYMEYHSDRFSDYSLMFVDGKKRVLAVLPANVKEDVLYSHQGLTFGGLVISKKTSSTQVLEVFQSLIDYAVSSEFLSSIIYKRIPDFYTLYPAQEDLYALFRINAELIRRDLSSVVELSAGYSYSKGRKWSVNKAKKVTSLSVHESEDFSKFWGLLSQVLDSQHQTKPTHSIDEIHLLKSKFPEKIRCFTATMDGEVLAGAVIYETQNVAHTQYLANSDEGKDLGALDLVIDHLLKNVYQEKRFFDFGISTTDDGHCLNAGLLAQKEGFGARACVHDFYEIVVR
jgi:hypothetical protein